MAFLKRNRSLVAALVAVYAVWRYGRYLDWGWLQVHNLPFVEGPLDYLLGHWELAAALGAVIFVAVFSGVRYALRERPGSRDEPVANAAAHSPP